jgi:hypothetical protein
MGPAVAVEYHQGRPQSAVTRWAAEPVSWVHDHAEQTSARRVLTLRLVHFATYCSSCGSTICVQVWSAPAFQQLGGAQRMSGMHAAEVPRKWAEQVASAVTISI